MQIFCNVSGKILLQNQAVLKQFYQDFVNMFLISVVSQKPFWTLIQYVF